MITLYFLDEFQELLKDYFSKNNLTLPSPVCYTDGDSVLSDTGEIDMLFLDMELPGHDGIYVGNMLKKNTPLYHNSCSHFSSRFS